jgi:hypothetical protein
MTTITVGDVLAEIKRQLAIGQPNVVLVREQAEYLHTRVIELLNEVDGLHAWAESASGEKPTQHLGPNFHIEHDKGR